MQPDENDLEMTRYVPVTRRTGLDPDLFDRYWSDVHGPICAAIPDLHLYTQYHLAPNQPDHWLTVRELSTTATAAEAIDGIAECGFTTRDAFDRWLVGAQGLKDDEQNCFDGTFGYYTVDGGSRTPKANIGRVAAGHLTVVALIRRRSGVETATFRDFIAGQLAPVLAASRHVHRIRYHLLEPFEALASAWQASIVEGYVPDHLRYHAAMEFVVEDRLGMRQLFDGQDFRGTLAQQVEMFEAVHPYPVRYAAVLVESGAPTLEGRRGWSTGQLIRKIGAVNAA